VGRLLNLASDASRPLTLPALCHLPPLPSVPPPAVPPPAPSLCFRSAVGRPWGKMGPRRGRMRPPRRGDHRRHGGLEGAVGLDGAGAARGWSSRRGGCSNGGGALFIEHDPVVVLTARVTTATRVLPVLACDPEGGARVGGKRRMSDAAPPAPQSSSPRRPLPPPPHPRPSSPPYPLIPISASPCTRRETVRLRKRARECTQHSDGGATAHRCGPCHVIRIHGRTGSS
jgi:hypothetical protein